MRRKKWADQEDGRFVAKTYLREALNERAQNLHQPSFVA
jgi:hypothetical protein